MQNVRRSKKVQTHRTAFKRTRAVRRIGAIAIVAGVLTAPLGPLAIAAPAAQAGTLPACPVVSKWPVRPLAADIRAVITKYYATRKMTPIKVDKNQMMVLNVVVERVGVHWCKNVGGGRSGYVGVVPKNATAAVQVHVNHKAYAVTGAAYTFVTVVKIPVTGWKVVSDDTAP